MKTGDIPLQERTSEESTDPGLEPLLRRPLRQSAHGVENQHGVAIGKIVRVEEDTVVVTLPCLDSEEHRARTICPLPEDCEKHECAVLFENGDPERPLVMGLMLENPAPSPNPDHVLHVDGERMVITAETELELRCGESVILLQRDGRIEIRGNYVTSQATATQRIRGGSIHMN